MTTDGSAGAAAVSAKPELGRPPTERLDEVERDVVLKSLLEQAPKALVMAIGRDGLFVPIPPSVPLLEHRVVQGRTSAVDLVPPTQMVAMTDAWNRAVEFGTGSLDVSVSANGEALVRLHFVDVAERHGVMIGVLVGGPESDGVGEDELPGFRPRLCEIRKDPRAVILEIDSAFTRILGWTAEELVGHRAIEIVHPEEHERAIANWMDMLYHAGSERRVRLRHRHRDGSWVWMEVTNHNRLADPEHNDVRAEMVDISDEMATQEALRASESLLRALTEALPLGILQFDLDRQIRYRNERIGLLLDRTRADTVDEQLSGVLPADRPAVEQALTAALAGQDCDLEVRIRRARRCHLRLRPLTDQDGEVTGALLSVADITEDTRLRDELRQRATYDALTQCLNRAAILDELEQALVTPETRSAGTAVIFFDVDHFKEVNDKLGHGAGDQLLVAVARRLRAAARGDDLVGRFGGDEFLVICRRIGSAELALSVANRIADALGEPLEVAHSAMRPKASIGVAWSTEETSADALIDRADIAMYESKRERLGRPILAR